MIHILFGLELQTKIMMIIYLQILLLLYWAGCLFIASAAVVFQVHKRSHATTSVRKIFHVLTVMVYIPGLIWQPTFLYLASGLVLTLFSLIEVNILYFFLNLILLLII